MDKDESIGEKLRRFHENLRWRLQDRWDRNLANFVGTFVEVSPRYQKTTNPTPIHTNIINHKSTFAQVFVVTIVFVNVIVVAVETQTVAYSQSLDIPAIYPEFNLFFLSVYISEFLLKVYAEPLDYWLDNYNKFDALILVLCLVQWGLDVTDMAIETMSVLRVMRALSAMRAFRVISFSRNLRVVVNALLNTLRKNVLDIIVLLLLIMFIFGVLGHYLYGVDMSIDAYKDWGTLGDAFNTLFILVCADGWLPYQERLTKDGYHGSEIFTAIFIFIGNFIIANLFIGVIIQNMDDATETDRVAQARKRREAKLLKRELFLRKQRKDMSSLINQTTKQNRNFQELLQEMVGQLRHEDLVPMTHIACNLTWLETFAVTLTHQENTMYRCQQLHFGIANSLAEFGKVP
ncbi:Cation channel sperm-associated protein 3 [Blyttiomyces sp. JEL0837]|nr:Cation channel sperm-associated protein 3 [Blyttiomyces sp. JEL0837]